MHQGYGGSREALTLASVGRGLCRVCRTCRPCSPQNPRAPNPITVTTDLLKGAEQGVTAALVDSGVLPQTDMPDVYPFVPSIDPGLSISFGQPGETFISALGGAIGSVLYDLNIPDFVNGTSDAGDFITAMAALFG
ncbi:hypothetical protein [Mycobacterium cookii]|nr:hypothetical protein [Mycobacterium cookii]MCV7329040.1 hypothetical protein [Mycobacterium cookii]